MNTNSVACLRLKNVEPRDWSVPIETSPKTIGRSPTADIQAPKHFRHLSRHHAEVWQDHDGLWIRDLQSRYGSHINGVWITHVPQASLVVGDSIWLGGLDCQVVTLPHALTMTRRWPGDDEDTPSSHEQEPQHQHPIYSQLTRAEIDVLLWISRGIDKEDEIAAFLKRSPHTVLNQINGIFKKLELHSRAELMGWIKRSTSPYYSLAFPFSLTQYPTQ